MIHFPAPLVPARLKRRYKRFLADAVLEDGRVVTAHCANSGAMLGCAPEGARIWLLPNSNPKAKLDWRWELVEVDGALVGINTSRPNAIAQAAILDGKIPELAGYTSLRREVPYGNGSRIDILAEKHGDRPEERCYIEVKSVTMKEDGAALFPDAITSRGLKHLEELAMVAHKGDRAVMLYLVQRADCDVMALAERIDPAYAKGFQSARQSGVEAYAYVCDLSVEGIGVARPLSIRPPASYP